MVLNEQVAVLQRQLCLPGGLTSRLKEVQLTLGDSSLFPSDQITWPVAQERQCFDSLEYLAFEDLTQDLLSWVGDAKKRVGSSATCSQLLAAHRCTGADGDTGSHHNCLRVCALCTETCWTVVQKCIFLGLGVGTAVCRGQTQTASAAGILLGIFQRHILMLTKPKNANS